MINTVALWVGYVTMVIGLGFILIWGVLALLDRGIRMLGLVYIVTSYAMKNHPTLFRIVQAGFFKRGAAPPQRRPS